MSPCRILLRVNGFSKRRRVADFQRFESRQRPVVRYSLLKTVLNSDSCVAVFQSRLNYRHSSFPRISLLPMLTNTLPGPSASKVTTLWRYTNLFIIILLLLHANAPVTATASTSSLSTDRSCGELTV